jgi:hypothetical protein
MSISSTSSLFSVHSYLSDEVDIPSPKNRPPMHRRKSSVEHNLAMRQIIKPWGGLSESPPGCQSVMYSSWSRFTASEHSTKSSQEMKASVLWAGSGTSPDFNPPINERVHLGVDHAKAIQPGSPEQEKQKLPQRPRYQRRPFIRTQSRLSTCSWSCDASHPRTDSMTFAKQPVKSASTNSLLTMKINEKKKQESEAQEQNNPIGVLSRISDTANLSSSMLPSAWESDSEDGDDW